jgi:hypothetical protein
MVKKFGAKPVAADAADQRTADHPNTFLAPNMSAKRPAGNCNKVYGQKKADKITPISAGSSLNCLMIIGAADEILTRSIPLMNTPLASNRMMSGFRSLELKTSPVHIGRYIVLMSW